MKKCAICTNRAASYTDNYGNMSIIVCKRCLEINKAERLYNERQKELLPYLEKKDYLAARNKINSIIKSMSKNSPIYVKHWLAREHLDWLAHFYYEQGNFYKAIDMLKLRAKKKWDTSYGRITDYLILADAYFKVDKDNIAKRTLENVLNIGIRERQPSAISALEKLRDHYGESLLLKPLYIQAIAKLCKIKKIEIPIKFKKIDTSLELIQSINWLTSIKEKWY